MNCGILGQGLFRGTVSTQRQTRVYERWERHCPQAWLGTCLNRWKEELGSFLGQLRGKGR